MSYVLHVWEGAEVSTLEQAHAKVFETDRNQAKQNPGFLAFAQALTAVYPDMNGGPDEDDEGYTESVWSESPIDGKTESDIYAIGIMTFAIDDRLFGFIADTAADHGLQVYDMQAGRLYRLDRTMIHHDGTSTPFPKWSKTSLVTPPRKAALSPEHVRRHLQQRLQVALGSHGWRLYQPERGDDWCLWRQIGEIRQGLKFRERFEGELFDLGLEFLFSCDRAIAQLIDFFPAYEKAINESRKNVSQKYGDISATTYELFGKENRGAFYVSPKSAEYASFGDAFQREFVKSSCCAEFGAWEDVDMWLERFLAWFAAHGEPALLSTNGISALHRRIDTPERRAEGLLRVWTASAINFSLITAYLANAPEIEAWFDAALSQLGRGLSNRVPNSPDVFAVLELLAAKVPGLPSRLSALFVERYAAIPDTLQKALDTKNDWPIIFYMSELKYTIGLSRAESVHAQAQRLIEIRNRDGDFLTGVPDLIKALNNVLTAFRE